MLNIQNINNNYHSQYISKIKNTKSSDNLNKNVVFSTYPDVYFTGDFASKIERPKTNLKTAKMLNEIFDKYRKNLEETDIFVINDSINELAKTSEFSKTEILEGMQVLTQFGNIRSIAKIGQTLEKHDVDTILNQDALFYIKANDKPSANLLKNNFGLNSTLDYIISQKNNYKLDGTKTAIFLDNNTIDNFEIFNKKFPNQFYKLKENKNIKFFLVSGLEDGISFLNRNKNLKDETLKLLKKAKKEGLSPQESIDKEKLTRIKALGIKPIIIKNTKTGTPQNIYNQLRPEQMSKRELNALIDATVLYSPNLSKENQTIIKEEIAQYLKNEMHIYTPERISKNIKLMHQEISNTINKLGKTMNDVIYLIPDTGKSYEMIAYQYQLINNIPKEKFITLHSPQDYNNLDTKNKVITILDDCSLSGTSLMEDENFIYCKAALYGKDDNINIILSPLIISEKSAKRINQKINDLERNNEDCIITTNIISSKHNNKLKNIIGSSGWPNNESHCIIFPHMCPDNNSELAANIGLFHNISYRKASNNLVSESNIKTYFNNAKKIAEKTEELLLQEYIKN